MPAAALPAATAPAVRANAPATAATARANSPASGLPATGRAPADAGDFLQALLDAGLVADAEAGIPLEGGEVPADAGESETAAASLVEGAAALPADPTALAEALRLAQAATVEAPRAAPAETSPHAAPRTGLEEIEATRARPAGEDPKRPVGERARDEEPVRRAAPEAPGVRATEEPPRHAKLDEVPPPGLEALARLHEAARPVRTEPVAAAIAPPVSSPAFAEAAAERVTWLVTQGIERAEIAVTPPDLGPIEATIRIENGEATIQIVAASAETRSALEQSLPRLAERLAENGLTLAGATVTADGGARREPGAPGPRHRRERDAVAAVGDTLPARALPARVGLVDDFA
jgi:flagellar hook-length control protein FliK